uniref:B-cell receptor CD22 first Ig-like domain-containing protein n=1 Tax=Salvator merianae TaxID=96440 RepID=A0A8D0C3T8_SALMN
EHLEGPVLALKLEWASELSKSLTAWEGSCLLIPCTFTRTWRTKEVRNASLVWYFDPSYSDDLQEFTGEILYSTINSSMLTSSVHTKFVGDLGNRNCSLKIFQLRKSNSGKYAARLYASVESTPNVFAFTSGCEHTVVQHGCVSSWPLSWCRMQAGH